MILRFITILSFILLGLAADEFEQWKEQQNSEFNKAKQTFEEWKKKEEKKFKAYLKAQDEAFKEYTKDIKKFWPIADTTSKYKWVEYSKDYSSKKTVDFKNEEIDFEVIAKNEKEARKKIEKLYKELLKDDVKSAYENDKLESIISKKLNTPKEELDSDDKIITDVLTKKDLKNIYQNIQKQKLEVVKYKGKFIYKAKAKLPAKAMIKKAKIYKYEVNQNASKQKIPAELIYAIIHSESSFNPMARSYVPAFGLMQIVPKTAGVDSYNFLYKKRKIPSARFLYNTKNNIALGSAYLHILYYKYLKDIKDPSSRLYCAIAAYNTGAGNVSKTFRNDTNIYKASKAINSMSSKEVYNYLLGNLPYGETKKYLKKVVNRTNSYQKLIEEEKL